MDAHGPSGRFTSRRLVITLGAAILAAGLTAVPASAVETQPTSPILIKRPDLVVSWVHDEIGVVTIKNQGRAPASAAFATFGRVGATGSHLVPALDPGWEHSFQTDILKNPNCGWVEADGNNTVFEWLEGNNYRSVGICVK